MTEARRRTIAYIEAEAMALHHLARQANLPMVALLLDMVSMQARREVDRPDPNEPIQS